MQRLPPPPAGHDTESEQAPRRAGEDALLRWVGRVASLTVWPSTTCSRVDGRRPPHLALDWFRGMKKKEYIYRPQCISWGCSTGKLHIQMIISKLYMAMQLSYFQALQIKFERRLRIVLKFCLKSDDGMTQPFT